MVNTPGEKRPSVEERVVESTAGGLSASGASVTDSQEIVQAQIAFLHSLAVRVVDALQMKEAQSNRPVPLLQDENIRI